MKRLEVSGEYSDEEETLTELWDKGVQGRASPKPGFLPSQEKGENCIKPRVGSSRSHQTPDIAMFKLKFFVVAIFAAIVHAGALNPSKFSRSLSFCGDTG